MSVANYRSGPKFPGSDQSSIPSIPDASKPLRVFKSATTGPIGSDPPRPGASASPPASTNQATSPQPTFVSKTTSVIPGSGPVSKQVNAFDRPPDHGQAVLGETP